MQIICRHFAHKTLTCTTAHNDVNSYLPHSLHPHSYQLLFQCHLFPKVNYFSQYWENCSDAQITCKSSYYIYTQVTVQSYMKFTIHRDWMSLNHKLTIFWINYAYTIVFSRTGNDTYFDLEFWINQYWINKILLYPQNASISQ